MDFEYMDTLWLLPLSERGRKLTYELRQKIQSMRRRLLFEEVIWENVRTIQLSWLNGCETCKLELQNKKLSQSDFCYSN